MIRHEKFKTHSKDNAILLLIIIDANVWRLDEQLFSVGDLPDRLDAVDDERIRTQDLHTLGVDLDFLDRYIWDRLGEAAEGVRVAEVLGQPDH